MDGDLADSVRGRTAAPPAPAGLSRLKSPRLGLSAVLAGLTAAVSPATSPAWADPSITIDVQHLDGPPTIWERDTLIGDDGGIRPFLAAHGIAVALTDIEEIQDNPAGGARQGSGYDGVTFVSLSANLETLVGWRGGVLGVAAGELRGHGISQFDVQNLLTVSNIETQPETRLFDLYLEQQLLAGQVTLRAGQMLPSDEFFSSHYAGPLINSSFGWPALLGTDLPGDDPTGLVSTPALWAKYDGGGPVSGQVGVYQGTSSTLAGPLEARNASSNGDGALIFAEAAYTIRPDGAGTLPAMLRLGGWYHTAIFEDFAVDQDGRSLALAGGTPRRYSGDYGGYAGIDALLHAVPGTADQGLGTFLRIAGAPGDRNLISFYLDAGLNYKGLIPGRGRDILALGVAWAEVGRSAAAYDADLRAISGPDYPVRDHETVVEATYQFAATPWWTIQPDLQYVIHPGIGGPDPLDVPADWRTPNAVVVGLRTSLRF